MEMRITAVKISIVHYTIMPVINYFFNNIIGYLFFYSFHLDCSFAVFVSLFLDSFEWIPL
jgi:hypothetical protein